MIGALDLPARLLLTYIAPALTVIAITHPISNGVAMIAVHQSIWRRRNTEINIAKAIIANGILIASSNDQPATANGSRALV